MRNQPVARLQQRKEHLVFIQLQELKELVKDVRIAQEVRAVVRTVKQKRSLNILKHGSYFLFNFRGNGGRRISIESREDVGPVLIIFRTIEFLQDVPYILFRQICNVVDSTLAEFHDNLVHHIFGNDGGFLGLKLVQDFIEMVNLLIRIVIAFLRWVTKTRKV